MDLKTSILVQVLADTDAVWLPSRHWEFPQPGNVYFARRAFAKGGVPWASHAATEAERKQTQRALDSLVYDGAMRVRRPHRVKTLGVRLTPESEARTRALVGLPGLYSAWLCLGELARHASRYDWVPERLLIGKAPAPGAFEREAGLVEIMILPALVRSFADSGSDTVGRVSYRLTPVGLAWLQRGNPPSPHDLGDELDRDAWGVYNARLRLALDRLQTASPPDRREIGGMPLPVSV